MAWDEFRIAVSPDGGDVSALHVQAPHEIATLVFAHGAGADMRHANMASITQAFAQEGISSVRFNFPFKEAGKSRVDGKPVSTATIAAALCAAQDRCPGPYFLGGHSFGGRMATHAMIDHGLNVTGMIFGSFPLHPGGKPSTTRADHLDMLTCPMLFLSGSRDSLAQAALMEQVVDRLGPRARLHWLDTADHGYKVLKRTRTRCDDVFTEMAGYAGAFVRDVVKI